VPNLTTPTTLVRGAKSFFVNDEDAAEFARSAPGIPDHAHRGRLGHSVQGDQPRALVEILRGVLAG
jgi:pimeloyl-ACP methyl ester carboxylesterase